MKKSLSKKFLFALLLFAAGLIICLCVAVGILFRQRILERYTYEGFSVTRMLANTIDGDRIADYLETRRADEYYETIERELNLVCKEFNLLYVYVAVPKEDTLVYIWDSDSDPSVIGTEDYYSPGGDRFSHQILSGERKEEELHMFKDPTYGELVTAASPVYDSEGNAVALAYADFSMDKFRQGLYSMLSGIVLVIVTILTVFSGGLYIVIKRGAVKQIVDLTHIAEGLPDRLDKGEKAYESNIHYGDEIEALSLSFEKMDKQLRSYIDENNKITAEKERIGAELDMATKIQADMLPSIFPAFPERSEFDIFASMDPAKEVGGDFYDFFLVDEDHLGMVIADVSGKGVPAALFMMMTKIMIQNFAMNLKSPADVLYNVNEQVCRNNKESMFVTVWLGIMEISTGKILASNGGHEYPVIKRPGEKFEIIKDRHGLPIGALAGMPYTDYEIDVVPGTKLFVYTDGVPEASANQEEFFGMDRLVEVLNSNMEGSPEDILHAVKKAVDDFTGDAPQFDDLTMLCVEYKGV